MRRALISLLTMSTLLCGIVPIVDGVAHAARPTQKASRNAYGGGGQEQAGKPEFARRVSPNDPSGGVRRAPVRGWVTRYRSGGSAERAFVSNRGPRRGLGLYERLGGQRQASLVTLIGGSHSGGGAVSSLRQRLIHRAPTVAPSFSFRSTAPFVGDARGEGGVFAALTHR